MALESKPDTNDAIVSDVRTSFHDGDSKDTFVIAHSQEIPQSFLDWTHDMREADAQFDRFGNRMVCAASIPQLFVDKWSREGYDIYREPTAKTIAKLEAENLNYFITTRRKI